MQYIEKALNRDLEGRGSASGVPQQLNGGEFKYHFSSMKIICVSLAVFKMYDM